MPKKRTRLMSEEAADLMSGLSAVHNRIDDLCDRFLDRIKCPGVPRGVLAQIEFGRYGRDYVGQLRHIADHADHHAPIETGTNTLDECPASTRTELAARGH